MFSAHIPIGMRGTPETERRVDLSFPKGNFVSSPSLVTCRVLAASAL